ncbi:clathrin light chain B-like isoform X1 [Sinocyclocheilus rhinocerous]|uniref:Clathrin light chain n=1 Tax=Sinocyclocheilus rhinocerous TaxID=307959 RepID=A0A673IQ44_9TELE|nr:PREDICTED: clathrin light chain B-like isoform X1 [Sinocyclocheilus rhinocerous]XP_016420410.1 PREDICTED: clathrin light chain B-like isoform X1 [Sinocyclocheilus rhinocerous]XP_016420412.1 PREDICTED: clathrin light chain B-like isoform X1 [Sinocyclocheilus rhinocerous]
MADDFGFSASDNGVHAEEDPAAAFLAQQENEIAVIENDSAGFGALEDGEPPPANTYTSFGGDFGEAPATAVNRDMFQDTNGTTDSYSAIAQVDIQRQEPESLRKWREEQKARLEELDAASKAAEAVWREKARKELEDWHVHQSEQMEKNKANNRIADKTFYKQPNSDAIDFVVSEEVFLKECVDDSPGTEWDKVARLCDFNPKTSRQTKDVSRMRSVLISLKQMPLLR